jgi:hypothetical protein
MGKTTPVSDGTGNPAYPCAMPLKSQADLQHKYPNGTRQPLFFASFCNKFPVTEEKALRRLVLQDCVDHQPNYLILLLSPSRGSPRHFRGLRGESGALPLRDETMRPPTRDSRLLSLGREFIFRGVSGTLSQRPVRSKERPVRHCGLTIILYVRRCRWPSDVARSGFG